uniref:Uncharacterized protein n=1 Tax=Candidatus Kentrum sp. DK TaxID=2126562 RepID=A0A450SUN6_9GAMM|nr:MAG: hypothetical protein BECKDK2373B_GA0170837_10687 [Candidatus Kentron sp. DK]
MLLSVCPESMVGVATHPRHDDCFVTATTWKTILPSCRLGGCAPRSTLQSFPRWWPVQLILNPQAVCATRFGASGFSGPGSLWPEREFFVVSSLPRFEAVKIFIIERHFTRGIRCALNVSVTEKHRKCAPIPPYKIPRNNGVGVGWNRCALSAFVSRTALPHTGVACRRQEFHAYKGTGNLGAVGLVPHSILFSVLRRTKRDRLLRCTSLK